MKIIGHAISQAVEVPREAYVVEVTTFWGNDDFFKWDTLELGPFKEGEHEANLYSLVETCQRMSDLYSRVLRHESDYSKVLGFEPWFNPTEFGLPELEAFMEQNPEITTKYGIDVITDLFNKAEGFAETYPYAVRWDSSISAEDDTPPVLKQYKVFYFDSDGKKFEVDITWSE